MTRAPSRARRKQTPPRAADAPSVPLARAFARSYRSPPPRHHHTPVPLTSAPEAPLPRHGLCGVDVPRKATITVMLSPPRQRLGSEPLATSTALTVSSASPPPARSPRPRARRTRRPPRASRGESRTANLGSARPVRDSPRLGAPPLARRTHARRRRGFAPPPLARIASGRRRLNFAPARRRRGVVLAIATIAASAASRRRGRAPRDNPGVGDDR